ncbi:hydrogenase accessory protein [Cyanobium sp. PCC 7001]|uniref:HupE/UreJ family protein n=1 Tax=Cyanobium sp. PCC 7001 TaxID=180281 RepID=UPI00018057CD|nr:HupE/UreJ family protein [Cyanobium sp. PCC 7001]EDY38820.1 hydrogenase accessory protein [Cyanobium sp. PCC 7001]
MTIQQRAGRSTGLGLALTVFSLALPARAHHLLDINGLQPTPLNGLVSGLLHPVIGPDHLLFLLALSLVGWQRRGAWMVALLAVGLLGSAAGLVAPGLPGAELIVAGTLSVVALVLWGWLPAVALLPAMALHGYVLSGSVLGWSAMPLASYGLGLLLSQAALLLLSLALLRRFTARLPAAGLRWAGALLVGVSATLALASGLA